MSKIFHYDLPSDRIAQRPLEKRDEARLMLVDRQRNSIEHFVFKDIVNFFSSGEVIVLNDSRVIPSRLYGKKDTGGHVELLLLRKVDEKNWEVLIRGKIKSGTKLLFGEISAVVLGRNKIGSWLVQFDADDQKISDIGRMPIPPYMKRMSDERDSIDYQTVYARKHGSIAAPTAGLHFTHQIFEQLRQKGVITCFLTLHIGWASFRKIEFDGEKPVVLPEFFEISEETASVINKAIHSGKKICAVGTSTVRAIESSFANGAVVARKGSTDLFIEPGYHFSCINRMITNFHLPGSTHLYMVCAFGGTSLIQRAYLTAIEKEYRFYSYGDTMLII
ncbi:MAG TPA: tRNA preQ1(34) S-adenosylmethionine ribosyltransferase-isomerase QueA [bacterium]|nr:tRNA preQ1(34) S-adenosylmethionine ribosyltransferase-isomerase QueA [bacterium]HOL50270.1 tRNA preQ1(34) S-adenosylmethionine ribosyltransferase-isomerase QueA [bacterium]HPO51557.1 tRNA preQ1(34) S-adenosylmethionine ribosyltransferase-isomerase QueA [bacterium]HXK45484.1 tRNA preQ1(34) S-adenosylmethionine ribosyltransferase-isomerase QueA [bacterium]